MFWYYNICKRELWLYSRSVEASQTDENIELGNFLHKINYSKNRKEVNFSNVKFDVVEKSNGELIITENKKSLKYEEASRCQLGYYLYLLKKNDINAIGYLACPQEKKRVKVELTNKLVSTIEFQMNEIQYIIKKEYPDAVMECKYCYNCAYRDYCYS
ncbi:CRISPR-associated protein Cas4 [Clostridium perfringens]